MCCTAAKFNVHTTQGFEKNQEIVRGLLGKARTKLEKEEILQRKKMERLERNLYVKNLDSSIDDERLRTMFRPFGFIQSAKVMTDFLGRSRGFGFVCFATKEEAINAKEEMNGVLIRGNSLYVSFAQLKEVRRAELKQKFGNKKTLESGQKRVKKDQAWKSAPSRWGDSRMESQWYEDVHMEDTHMEDVNENRKMRKDQRDDWYENYFSYQTKADRRRNPGLKSRIVRAPTPDWIVQERMDQENRFRNTKKPKWGPPMLDQSKGSEERMASEEAFLNLTVGELFELKEKMSDQEKVKIMLLGDRWVDLFGGKEKLWKLCNAENISAEIMDSKRKVDAWLHNEATNEDGWGTSSDPSKVRKHAFKWSEMMNIDDEEIKWDTDEVEKRSAFPENAMASLPKNIWENIEKYLRPWEKVRIRTATKSIMENWWIRPRDDIPYLKWVLCIQEEQINHIKIWKEAMRQYDEDVKLQKERKIEQEEREREERLPLALDYYIANHGIIPGIGFGSVARMFNVYKKELQEEYWRYEEETQEMLQD